MDEHCLVHFPGGEEDRQPLSVVLWFTVYSHADCVPQNTTPVQLKTVSGMANNDVQYSTVQYSTVQD